MHVDDVVIDRHDRAWRPLPVDGVDHDDGVVALLKIGHELDPGDAGFDHGDVGNGFPLEQPVRHFNTEGVVASQHVPDAGDQDVHDALDVPAERRTSAARMAYPWMTHQAT